MRATSRSVRTGLIALALAGLLPALTRAEEWPSVFRGVVVADSPSGVRVISVEPTAAAFSADLRPEDVILQIGDEPIHTIDEFAVLSKALKGRAAKTRLLILRNGQPKEMLLTLYSDPLQREWGLTFMPNQELRFVDANAGRSYWANLGRGFEEAGQAGQALDAYLNALHHTPQDLALAMKASELMSTIAVRHVEAGRVPEALGVLGQQVTLLNNLFNHPLTDEQLRSVRVQLQSTITRLKQHRPSVQKDT